MYCKHCGKEIDSDAKFCQYCGTSQNKTNINNNEDSTQKTKKDIVIPNIKTNWSPNTKWSVIKYSIWFILNLYWLFAGNKEYHANEYFMPFSNKFIDFADFCAYYDFTEFIIYTIGIPLIILSIKIWRKKRNNNETQNSSQTNTNVENINDSLGI